MAVVLHEPPKPVIRGVTLYGDQIGIIIGSEDDEAARDHLGRVRVRTTSVGEGWRGPGGRRLDRISFESVADLSAFAHGILRLLGEE